MDLLEVLPTHDEHRFAQANGGSTNIDRVAFHAILLPSKHYLIMLRVQYEDWDIHDFLSLLRIEPRCIKTVYSFMT